MAIGNNPSGSGQKTTNTSRSSEPDKNQDTKLKIRHVKLARHESDGPQTNDSEKPEQLKHPLPTPVRQRLMPHTDTPPDTRPKTSTLKPTKKIPKRHQHDPRPKEETKDKHPLKNKFSTVPREFKPTDDGRTEQFEFDMEQLIKNISSHWSDESEDETTAPIKQAPRCPTPDYSDDSDDSDESGKPNDRNSFENYIFTMQGASEEDFANNPYPNPDPKPDPDPDPDPKPEGKPKSRISFQPKHRK